MSSTFGRRLFLVTAAEIAAVFCCVVAAAMLLVFGGHLATLRGDLSLTLDRVVAAIDVPAARKDARIAAPLAALRYPRSTVVVILVDERRRAAVWQTAHRPAGPSVDVRARGDFSGEPHAAGAFPQFVMGLATTFGLRSVRAHIGAIDVIVKPSDTALAATVASWMPEFFAALAFALALAIVLARMITQQVLRPLVDVTTALQRFASGQVSPQTIAADPRADFGSLAVAYNAAIAQMERAFGERDRANAAMRQFINDAGHQLRTPLTVVRGFIAILRKGDLRSPEDRDRILETMNRQSQLMGSLIEKLMLLDSWQDEARHGASEPIEVAQLVEDVVLPMAEAQPGRRVQLAATSVGLASIDPIDFTHALTNVVDNALKYTRGAIDVSVRRTGDRIEIAIADEGPGMNANEASHAFDRFYRGARRDVDGSGLGLAIARRAIERAGGSLELESAPATGSRLTIALPATRS
ncbi:MAG: HAMP domain-containing histidine kinase [Candidatus Eremiobacteraeota bacterium]|nr:HAMP domain-containing histidine kinase [Candidatus Eremiobacteraeota bacterium]